MKRKRLTRAESQQRTRVQLLDAAAEVFSQRGFYATSVEEVAESAGFSKGAIYSNFASKEELFLAVLGHHLEQELLAVERSLAAPVESTLGEPLDQTSLMLFSHHLEQARTWNVLTMEFWLFAMRDERARELLAARYRAVRAELAERLGARYRDGGGHSPVPVEYLAWAVPALGIGLAVQAYLEPGTLPDRLYRTVVGQLLGEAVPSGGK